MRKFVDMLPSYGDDAWREFSPEYREYALQDIDNLRCDIDFAKTHLTEQAELMERLEQAIRGLMPILRNWEPDNSSQEDRDVIREAQKLIVIGV